MNLFKTLKKILNKGNSVRMAIGSTLLMQNGALQIEISRFSEDLSKDRDIDTYFFTLEETEANVAKAIRHRPRN